MPDTDLGVVVVGVGIAGRARIRDLQSSEFFPETKNVKLKGFVSRRQLDIEGVPQLTLEAALARDDIHIVVICTENQRHESLARQAIEAKKHVLVEYPLAISASAAKDVLRLAEENGVLCYEEDISFLSPMYIATKEEIKAKPALREGEISVEATFNGWIEKFEDSGSPFVTSMSIVHNLLDLFGDLKVTEAEIKKDETSYTATATLLTKDDKPLKFHAKREKTDQPKRKKTYCYKFEDDTTITSPPPGPPPPMPVLGDRPAKPGLFMQDFWQFLKTLNKERDHTHQQWLTTRGLELAEEMTEKASGH